VATLRFGISSWMLSTPARARCYTLLRPATAQRLVRSDTAIVIEGYPRSANTYAATAFRSANPGVRYASHLHSPVNVEQGVGNGIPVLVLLRHPVDAVISQLQFHPGLSPRLALRAYVRFYRRVLPLVDDIVLATFETVTSDFGHVVSAVNRRFHTAFAVYDPTPDNERVVRDLITWEDRLFRRSRSTSGWTVAWPSPQRDESKPSLRQLLLTLGELHAAQELYDRLRVSAI
jgi:hypothetical protein